MHGLGWDQGGGMLVAGFFLLVVNLDWEFWIRILRISRKLSFSKHSLIGLLRQVCPGLPQLCGNTFLFLNANDVQISFPSNEAQPRM